MSVLKLTYCHLIKIILSQIGGNPIQQVYSQLSQGMPMMTARSGILPQGLSEVKNLIDTVTSVINAAQQTANDFSDTIERLGGELYQNPIGASINAAVSAIDAKKAANDGRLAVINAEPATPPQAPYTTLDAEKSAIETENSSLTSNKSSLQTLLSNTNRLSGVGPQSSASTAGGCSLQDLLGSGCSPNDDVPDVDLKALIESLKSKDAIDAITQQIQNATGYSDLVGALASFKSEVDGFNLNFNNLINKAAVRNAVTAQLTQIVYNLLSGCGNTVYDLTLKSSVKDIVSVYAEAIEAQNNAGDAYYDSAGNVVTIPTVEVAPTLSNIKIN